MAMPAFASVPNMGRPTEGGLGFQPAVTRIGERIDFFHDVLMVIITLITIFVTVLLLWVMVRYNRKANPVDDPASVDSCGDCEPVLPELVLHGRRSEFGGDTGQRRAIGG
jgi:cytochrome c oxidase subunit 2